jgi:hypothetical protein
MKILAVLSLIVGVGWTTSARASMDVTCVHDDCLTYGWKIRDTKSLGRGFVECVDEDCKKKGWYETSMSGQTFLNECARGGCWVEGWDAVDRAGRLLASARCLSGGPEHPESDCLSFGWTVRQANGMVANISCLEHNCREKGWEITLRGAPPQLAHCKPGGCFTEGWRLYY